MRYLINLSFFGKIICTWYLFFLLISLLVILGTLDLSVLVVFVIIIISIVSIRLFVIIASSAIILPIILLLTNIRQLDTFILIFLMMFWTSWGVVRDFLESTFQGEMMIYIKIYVYCSYCRNTFKVNHTLYYNSLYILFRCNFGFTNNLLLLLLC